MSESVRDHVADRAEPGPGAGTRRAGTRRVPPLALGAWLIALAGLAALGVAVAHYLSGSGGHLHSMTGMSGMSGMSGMAGESTGHALTRAGGSPVTPLLGSALVTAWQLDAITVAVLVVLAALYVTGIAFAARRSGVRWPWTRTALFALGLLVCAFATNGSIAVYDQVLFTAHMAGHLALVMVAPALLVAGRPLTLALAASRPARRARLERIARGPVVAVLTAPPVALATYAAVIVGSHLTGLMDLIMRNAWAGQVEHLVYLLAGYQFFVLIIGDEPIRWRLASPARWLLLAIAMAVDTFTGIVLMQGTHAVELAPAAFGVDALSDTRTGGAIMWFGGDAIMAVIMIGLVVSWLRHVDLARPDRGWLEQARSATFAAHTAGVGGAGASATAAATAAEVAEGIDTDDRAREAYNDWLARLNR